MLSLRKGACPDPEVQGERTIPPAIVVRREAGESRIVALSVEQWKLPLSRFEVLGEVRLALARWEPQRAYKVFNVKLATRQV